MEPIIKKHTFNIWRRNGANLQLRWEKILLFQPKITRWEPRSHDTIKGFVQVENEKKVMTQMDGRDYFMG